ncbi:MAG: ATP-binding cassette domain-containing protein [Bacteroidota bacterium]
MSKNEKMLNLNEVCLKQGKFSLKSISLTVEKGDYFILLGVSGAGKSMILETIAGLLKPVSGTILMNGNNITNAKIQDRKIGLVFQDHAIFPHMTVYENLAFSLHGKKLDVVQKMDQIATVAAQMSITGLLNRKPSTLSGGELQRVALARTLSQNPSLLLLDEPLSSLDVQLKDELRTILRKLNRSGQTIIHVTHDYDEAVSLGNKLAVVHQGTILQQGTPDEVFSHPSSEFVAHFTGARNFFKAKPLGAGTINMVEVEGKVKVFIPESEYDSDGYILLRNEDIFLSLSEVDTSAVNNFKGTVKEIIPSRHGVEVRVDIGITLSVSVTRESFTHLALSEFSLVWVHFKATAVRFIKKF